jgi:hypothetical protein
MMQGKDSNSKRRGKDINLRKVYESGRDILILGKSSFDIETSKHLYNIKYSRKDWVVALAVYFALLFNRLVLLTIFKWRKETKDDSILRHDVHLQYFYVYLYLQTLFLFPCSSSLSL